VFQTPQCWEIANRIGEHNLSRQCDACSDSRQILFRHSNIEKTVWELMDEWLDHAKSKISYDQEYPVVTTGKVH